MTPPFGSGQRVRHLDVLDVDDFAPELLMTPEEVKVAKSLMRRVPTYEQMGGSLPEKSRSAKQQAASARAVEIRHQRRALARDVLRRSCGLEIFMVLHVARDDGFEVWIQAHEFDLTSYGPFKELAWQVTGAALRKDKSIGSKREYGTFRAGRVERRCLDGRWTRIKPSGTAP